MPNLICIVRSGDLLKHSLFSDLWLGVHNSKCSLLDSPSWKICVVLLFHLVMMLAHPKEGCSNIPLGRVIGQLAHTSLELRDVTTHLVRSGELICTQSHAELNHSSAVLRSFLCMLRQKPSIDDFYCCWTYLFTADEWNQCRSCDNITGHPFE
ncbi:hypothetical protein KC19_3G177200 [Ceratodon purpureus]|uniref:Uncharacterized protein n=1 Tax=Ceratodon purpureus TaxID=3225 RepID=A0A8T0ING5_CERPU|nr:hypothetical protein KC19_3G177200 [Ceratodon purpureus]